MMTDLRIKELLGMDGAQELMDLENKEGNDDRPVDN